MRKARLRKVMRLAQGHTSSKWKLQSRTLISKAHCVSCIRVSLARTIPLLCITLSPARCTFLRKGVLKLWCLEEGCQVGDAGQASPFILCCLS